MTCTWPDCIVSRVSAKARPCRATWLAIVAATIAGCASAPLRDAVPEQLVAAAEVPGLERVRIWGDGDASDVERFLQTEGEAIREKWQTKAKASGPLVTNILALSGGADDGAFGAGLLVGWGEAGTRPEFDLVTGISAGALIAPLAFVGKEFDHRLATVFTQNSGSQIYEATLLDGLFGGDSLASSGPLQKLIEDYVDAGLVRRVAEERAKGRILIIGTTNIDAQRPVFWDMGRIAQSQSPDSITLFRKVLLASASIPGVFPPVHIPVSASGKTYQELHVDGGATRQLFLTPGEFSFKAVDKIIGKKIQRRLYIIRNGKIGPEYKATPGTALALATRSLETVTKSQGIGDLVRMYEKSKRDGITYNLIAIPNDFSAPRKAPFELEYMKPLYERGLTIGRGPIPWQDKPPSL